MRYFQLLLIMTSIAGLFFEWSRIQFMYINGLVHWSGMLILLFGITSFVFIMKRKRLYIWTLLLLCSIPLLSVIQYIYFAPILMISSIDLQFSQETVQLGFYITFISGILSFLLLGSSRLIKKHDLNPNNVI
ncbi:hypothetical protein WAK64_12910 [Bacillus spongiae]|uniref:Uncharacterized protein n=1 Tax=Bacillus spongiae TaxID=2683610 RepID=A0ABU8HF22_9BACI